MTTLHVRVIVRRAFAGWGHLWIHWDRPRWPAKTVNIQLWVLLWYVHVRITLECL